jgi:hypothetical protein
MIRALIYFLELLPNKRFERVWPKAGFASFRPAPQA